MKKNKSGVILNISATLHYRGDMLQFHAGAAKAANDALLKHAAQEWGRYGIRTVGIAPGLTVIYLYAVNLSVMSSMY